MDILEWLLLRHPDAVHGEDDRERAISLDGWEQVREIEHRALDFNVAVTSPAKRTRDAANRLAAGRTVITIDELYDAGEEEAAIMALYERIGEEPFLSYLIADAPTLLRYGRRAKDALDRVLSGRSQSALVVGHHPLLQALAFVIIMEQLFVVDWTTVAHDASFDGIVRQRLGKAEVIRIDSDGRVSRF